MKFFLFLFCISIFAEENLSEKSLIPNQSFDVELEDFGKVKLEAHSVDFKLKLILKKSDKIIFNFPEKKTSWSFEELKAVSFFDIDGDKKKDVVLVLDYITGIGPEAAVPFSVPLIYLSKTKKFILDEKFEKLSEKLYKMKKEITIKNIKQIYKSIR